MQEQGLPDFLTESAWLAWHWLLTASKQMFQVEGSKHTKINLPAGDLTVRILLRNICTAASTRVLAGSLAILVPIDLVVLVGLDGAVISRLV